MKRDGIYWYDDDAAERVVEFFPRYLKHIKGPWAGRRFELDEWQKDQWIRPLFGWKRPHSVAHKRGESCDPLLCEYGRRRYRAANIILPRKNTKTTTCAGLELVGLAADDERGGENYCMAGDLDQASDLLFDIAATMVEKSAALRKRLKVWRSTNRIVDAATDSFLQAIPADWEGGLGFSPHIAVMDEYLVQANTDLENAITSGMGTRRQPIFLRLSTVGKTLDSPVGRLYQRIKDIERGVREARPDELNILYEAPANSDWRKRKTWVIANPGFGKSLQPAFVDGQIRKAVDEPAERGAILQYGLNIWPDALAAWMPLEKWDACVGIVDLEELEGEDCIIAVSMPSAVDLAAVTVLFPPKEEGKPYRFLTEFYLPGDVMVRRQNEENAPPYQEWLDAGALTVFEDSDVLDYDALKTVVLSKYGSRFEVREIVCNPRGAMQFIQVLQNEDANVVELVPQFKTMSPALTELRRLVGLGRKGLIHNGNIALRWMWTKAKVKVGPNDEIRPDVQRSLGNIQGVVSLAMALNRAIVVAGEEDAGWQAV
jgi:phage terminase large subunit-like protein